MSTSSSQAFRKERSSVRLIPNSLPRRRENSSTRSHVLSSELGRGARPATQRNPSSSIVSDFPDSSWKVMDSPSRENPLTRAVKLIGSIPNAATSTTMRDSPEDHFSTAFQNLSLDEVMFVSHIYNWGLIQAKRIATRFHYVIQQPLPVLLAAMNELDKNCSAQSAKRKAKSSARRSAQGCKNPGDKRPVR